MNPYPNLLIRADASAHIGTGHVMRMVALAQAWQDQGGHATIASCQCPQSLIERIRSEYINFAMLSTTAPGGTDDMNQTIQLGQSLNSMWIVLDGYHFREDYHQKIKESNFRILAVDDYGHCESWKVDLLLNQNLHAADQFRRKPVGLPETKLMLGTDFALLRREFRTLPRKGRIPNEVPRVLITFGGVDSANATGRIIGILSAMEPDWDITVLTGPGNPHLEAIRSTCARMSNTVILHAVTDMPALYAAHDAVISAAGSSCYEWLRYGLPALVYVIADNQEPLVPHLNQIPNVECPAWLSGCSDAAVRAAIKRLISRADASLQLPACVDGTGAGRVVSRMLES